MAITGETTIRELAEILTRNQITDLHFMNAREGFVVAVARVHGEGAAEIGDSIVSAIVHLVEEAERRA